MILFALIHFLSAAAFSAQKNCPPDKYPVRAHQQSAYYKADGTFVSAGWKDAFCRSYTGIRKVWLPRLLTGKPTPWNKSGEQNVEWKPDEIERLMDVLEELPRSLVNLLNRKVFRLRSSEEKGNAASTGGGNLALYDAAFDTTNNLAHVVAHEAAHYLYLSLPKRAEEGFLKVAKWAPDEKSTSGFKNSRPSDQFVRDIGKISPREDFSDSIATFVTQPSKLKKTCPEIYNWIKATLGKDLESKEK